MKRSLVYASLVAATLLGSCGPGIADIPSVTLKFPEGKNVVEIPFTRYRNWIIIQATVNDKKALSFILDTGAPIALLGNKGLANQLNLHITGNIQVKGSDSNEPRSVPLAGDVTFRIGGIEITNGVMAVGAGGEAISGVDGIIGKYLFDHAAVRIDWVQNKVVVTKPDQFTYKGSGEILPVYLTRAGHMYTEITVRKKDREMTLNALIDLGKRSAFTIDQHASSSIVNDNAGKLSNILLGRGANGPIYGDVTRTDVSLRSFQMNDVVTTISGSADDIEKGDIHGSIGVSLLERFDPIFDQHNQRLILEKNEGFQAPLFFNRSGIILGEMPSRDFLLIGDIIPNSPAAENALMKGDAVVSINGTRVHNLSMDSIDDLVGGKGLDTIELEVQRGNELIKKKLTLRSLLE